MKKEFKAFMLLLFLGLFVSALAQKEAEDGKEQTPKESQTPEFKTIYKTYTSRLTKEEVESYMDEVSYKNSFIREEAVLSNLPKSFQPQDSKYLDGIIKFNIIFFIFGGIILALVIGYCILRFCFKKCLGPLSLRQVDKAYKTVTWIIVGASIIAFVVIYLNLIIPSLLLG